MWWNGASWAMKEVRRSKGEERHEVFPRSRREVPVSKVLPLAAGDAPKPLDRVGSGETFSGRAASGQGSDHLCDQWARA